MKQRQWATIGVVLITVAAGWLLREFWLPLVPVWGDGLKVWSEEWGNTVQTLADVLATIVLIGGGLATVLGLRGGKEERTEDKPKESLRDLLKPSTPITSVNIDELTRRLGNSGNIPYVDRGITDRQTLVGTNRLAIVGPMKSGKTREAIELMRRTQDGGVVVSIYEPTSSLDWIEASDKTAITALRG